MAKVKVIRVRLLAYDHKVLDLAVKKAIDANPLQIHIQKASLVFSILASIR